MLQTDSLTINSLLSQNGFSSGQEMLSRHGASFSSSHGQEFGGTSLGAVVVGQSIGEINVTAE